MLQRTKYTTTTLKSAKSSRGKKAIWGEIDAEFEQAYDEARQMKNEKCRALFEKYKAVCDNNSKLDEAMNPMNFAK